MKLYLTIILPILFLISLVPVFSFANAEKYQDDSFGYSMNVPDEYLVSKSFNGVVIITYSEKKNQANGIDNISILVTKNDGKPFSETIQLVKNDIENFGNTITDEMEIELGGNNTNDDDDGGGGGAKKEAILIKSYIDIGVPVFFENVVAYHGNHAYFLTVTYTDNKTQKAFHEMLESFDFADDDDDYYFIPQWIKDVSERWTEEKASDEEFANAMRHMLSIVSSAYESITEEEDNDRAIFFPPWIKEVAASWSQGEIDNQTWKNMILYLYEKGLITIIT